ncbi:MAG: hypothetical protein WC451_00475 [Patescibacteria group bacterium]
MSQSLRFVAGSYDEQTMCIIADVLDQGGFDSLSGMLGHVDHGRGRWQTALYIRRRDGRIAVIGYQTMRKIIRLLREIPLTFDLVVSCRDLQGTLDFHWANDMEPFKPPIGEADDPFWDRGQSTDRKLTPEMLSRIADARRASGDGDLNPDL